VVCASKPWSISSVCANLREQLQHHPIGAEISSSEQVDLGVSNITSQTSLVVDQSSPDIFAERGRNRCRHISFPILAISIRSMDIRMEVVLNHPEFCTFLTPPRFVCVEPPYFGTRIIKVNILSMTWQSFTSIGGRSSAISR